MSPEEFEPTSSAGQWPQTYALDSAASGTGLCLVILHFLCEIINQIILFEPVISQAEIFKKTAHLV